MIYLFSRKNHHTSSWLNAKAACAMIALLSKTQHSTCLTQSHEETCLKKYQMYGIGNALVDMDYETNLQTLARLDISKGVMTLIDEERHHHLVQELVDVRPVKAFGGSAANTLFTMQQLGAKTFYSCKVGDDAEGDFYYQDLINNGIDTNLHEGDRSGITGKCLVFVTPDADRSMNTYLGATAEFSLAQVSETALKNSEFVYIEGYLVAQAAGCAAAVKVRELAQEHGIKIALTLSDPNMVTYFKENFAAIIGTKVDILFCNKDEAFIFTDSNTLEDAQEKLKAFAKTFVITLGGDGALIYDGHTFMHTRAYKVPVIDTVGAGDVFSGVFMYAITHGYNYLKAGELASFAAAKVVSKFGPRLNDEEITEVRHFGTGSKVMKTQHVCCAH